MDKFLKKYNYIMSTTEWSDDIDDISFITKDYEFKNTDVLFLGLNAGEREDVQPFRAFHYSTKSDSHSRDHRLAKVTKDAGFIGCPITDLYSEVNSNIYEVIEHADDPQNREEAKSRITEIIEGLGVKTILAMGMQTYSDAKKLFPQYNIIRILHPNCYKTDEDYYKATMEILKRL